MKTTNKGKLILTTASWYSLLIALLSCAAVSFYAKKFNWILFITLFAILYPLLCYTFVFVKFYEDRIVVIRPLSFIHHRKIYLYTQIDYLRVLNKYFSREPFDLLVYLRNQKKTIALPLPFSIKKEKKLESLMQSKGIKITWEILE